MERGEKGFINKLLFQIFFTLFGQFQEVTESVFQYLNYVILVAFGLSGVHIHVDFGSYREGADRVCLLAVVKYCHLSILFNHCKHITVHVPSELIKSPRFAVRFRLKLKFRLCPILQFIFLSARDGPSWDMLKFTQVHLIVGLKRFGDIELAHTQVKVKLLERDLNDVLLL